MPAKWQCARARPNYEPHQPRTSLAGSFPDLRWSHSQTTYESGNRDPYLPRSLIQDHGMRPRWCFYAKKKPNWQWKSWVMQDAMRVLPAMNQIFFRTMHGNSSCFAAAPLCRPPQIFWIHPYSDHSHLCDTQQTTPWHHLIHCIQGLAITSSAHCIATWLGSQRSRSRTMFTSSRMQATCRGMCFFCNKEADLTAYIDA